MITQIKLDESTKLEFGVAITGADSTPTARFIIEGKQFSLMLPCKQVNENMEVEIPAMKRFFSAGEYSARLEIVLDNKIYTPLQESVVFEPSIEIATKQKPVAIKESVKVSTVTVKKLDESLLRKTQAATILAQSLHYTPTPGERPEDIIKHAIESAGTLAQEQAKLVNEMLTLAESVGIDTTKVEIKQKPIIIEKKTDPEPEDDFTDSELEDMIHGLNDDDYIESYDDDELAVVDDETGEEITEGIDESELNEVLSRAERLKARVRMARTATKREAKLRIALKKHSSTKTINHRARRLAINAMKKKLAKNKPLSQLQTTEKERIERIVARKKNALDRLAMKLVPRVRSVEKERLAHHTYTK